MEVGNFNSFLKMFNKLLFVLSLNQIVELAAVTRWRSKDDDQILYVSTLSGIYLYNDPQ